MAKEKAEKAKKIVIQYGNERAVATLLWDEAPTICSKIWESLPLESQATLAKVCNHEIIFMLPLVIERENLKPVTIGDVGWWDVRSAVNIWFADSGPAGPLGLTALFAKVTENLEGLARESMKVWTKPGVRVKLTRLE